MDVEFATVSGTSSSAFSNHEAPVSELKIIVATVPDRDEPVTEIWSGSELWAELRAETGRRMIEIYPRSDGDRWSFDLDLLLDALQKASTRIG